MFQTETPESIHTSFRKGEWVTSIDLSDVYLHLPIHPQSRKFLRFHHKGVLYQFSSPSGVHRTSKGSKTLCTKKQGIRIHQYLEDWLIRSSSKTKSKIHKKSPFFGPDTRFRSELTEIRAHSTAEVRFQRILLFARSGYCQTHQRQMEQNSGDFPQDISRKFVYQCKDSYIHHWITSIHREN